MNKFEKEEERQLTRPSAGANSRSLVTAKWPISSRSTADSAERLFPALTGAPKGIDLYAVLGADGTPLALTDSRSAAIANAIENDLVPVSVH